MRVVVDTNVAVSALLSPGGLPSRILGLAASGKFQIVLSPEILAEYRDVLGRPKLKIKPVEAGHWIESLAAAGVMVQGEAWREPLPDPCDAMFLEAAWAGRADFLVSGNLKHFPKASCREIVVVSPREFMDIFETKLA